MQKVMLGAALCAMLFGAAAAPVAAGDFDTLKVAERTMFEKAMAGPADTGMLLSPDGSRALHLGHRAEACVYDLTGPAPVKANCAEFPERPISPEDTFWSPDGTRILWPIFGVGFVRFRDPDIQFFEPGDPTRLWNLTDDFFLGSAFNKGPGNFDVSARWLDSDTIIFARYAFGKDGLKSREPGVIMSVEMNALPNQLLAPVPVDGFVVSVDGNSDGSKIAFVADGRKKGDGSGVYVLDVATGTASMLVPISAIGEETVFSVTYSADDRYLLAIARDKDGYPKPSVIEVATGAVTNIAPAFQVTGVGWSPTGSALAYLTNDPAGGRETPTHLNLAEPPTAPGRLLDTGPFMTPICCGAYPVVWAANDTMILGNREEMDQPFLIRFER